MAEETPEDRLEAALERIARIVDAGSGASNVDPKGNANNGGAPNPAATEVADRLDRIIDTLREALGQ